MKKNKKIDNVSQVVDLVLKELERASASNKPFNSPHEGFAVLLEEVDELWDEVKKKTKNRDNKLMQDEAVQIAAMGIRFITDLCMK